MYNNEIIRAWKDEDYFDSLSEEQLSLLPDNPAGVVELADEDMEVVAGGWCGRGRGRGRRGRGWGAPIINIFLIFNIEDGDANVSLADNDSNCNFNFA